MQINIERVLRESPIPVDPRSIDEVHQRLFKRPKRHAPDHYEIHEELGRGQFGRVYRATDKRFPRSVALKVIAYDSPQQLARIEREAHALARLSHPNIVTIFDKGIADVGTYFLATELVDGTRLDEWIRDPSHPLDRILEVFAQAAEGLHHAHQRGVVHRDFKPTNAIVDESGRLRILDFGLVRLVEGSTSRRSEAAVTQPDAALPRESDGHSLVEELTQASATDDGDVVGPDGETAEPYELESLTGARILGTPAYASLEQLEGKLVDPRSDQFSLCISLFEATHGFRPFSGRTVVELSEKIASGTVANGQSQRRVPRWLKRLLRRGLSPSPEDRFENVGQIADALRAHLTPRTRWWVGLAAGVGLTLGAVALSHELGKAKPPVIALTWEGAWPDDVEPAVLGKQYGLELLERLGEFESTWKEVRDGYAQAPEREADGPTIRCLEAGKRRFHDFVAGLSRPREPSRHGLPFELDRIWFMHLSPPRGCLDPVTIPQTDDQLIDRLVNAQAERLAGRAESALAQLEPLRHEPAFESGRNRGVLDYEIGSSQLLQMNHDAWHTLAHAVPYNGGDPELLVGLLARQLEAGVVLDVANGAQVDMLVSQLRGHGPTNAAFLAMAEGYAAMKHGLTTRAVEAFVDAQKLWRDQEPSAYRNYMVAHSALHETYAQSGSPIPAERLGALESALATIGEIVGRQHPLYVRHAINVARIMGDTATLESVPLEVAKATFERAAALLEDILPHLDDDPGSSSHVDAVRARAERLMLEVLRLDYGCDPHRCPEWLAAAESIDDALEAVPSAWPRRDAFRVQEIVFGVRVAAGDLGGAWRALGELAIDARAMDRVPETCEYFRALLPEVPGPKKILGDDEFEKIEARLRPLCG